MSMNDYKDALKMGQKAYREAVAHGNYPYLPVLEDIISFTNIESEMTLGICEIPIDRIIGTKTAGRTTAFACNFMPLLEMYSEFSMKWDNLATALKDEGLRDPIKVYEYMNYFYVQEGNKRVSVMKFLGSPSIPGNVIRVIPKRSNTYENKLYYEYMYFHRITDINYMTLSRLGDYRKLLKAVGMPEGEPWDEDTKKDFRALYVRFEKAYRAKAGDNLPIGVGDALLMYLTVYPYEETKNQLGPQLKKNIAKSWDEYLVAQNENTVTLSMNPDNAAKGNIIKKIIKETTRPVYKIAFIYDKNAQSSGWTYGHEMGRRHLMQHFSDRIVTNVYDNINASDPKAISDAIEQAIGDGNVIIFATSPKFLKACVTMAVKYPDVKILNCSVNTKNASIRSYYARMYEAKFLIGALAGAMSGSDNIGYIADYPIYGTTANINAFALGAKMVNPRAKVFLEWSSIKDRDIHDNLKRNGACFISDKDIIVPQEASRDFGLYYEDASQAKGETNPANMATPIWHWGRFYEMILRSIASGSWKSDPGKGALSVNYWWGLSSGVIDVILSSKMPDGTKRMIELLRNAICTGEFHPFAGRIMNQEGEIMHNDAVPMTPEEIMTMDWLVDNVVGYIPSPDELTDAAKEIVAISGVKQKEI